VRRVKRDRNLTRVGVGGRWIKWDRNSELLGGSCAGWEVDEVGQEPVYCLVGVVLAGRWVK
jgi:hypothetical protein